MIGVKKIKVASLQLFSENVRSSRGSTETQSSAITTNTRLISIESQPKKVVLVVVVVVVVGLVVLVVVVKV